MTTAYQVKQEVFEGPFDLLLKAIDDGQVEIRRVSLAQIVTAYFEYWRSEGPELLAASDFVFMAACLIELKSKELLPVKEATVLTTEDSTVEEALVAHIQEYQVYKQLALNLKERKAVFDRIYGRHEGEAVEGEIELKDVSLRDLVFAFQKVYREAARREQTFPIQAEEVTLEERLIEIKRLIAGRGGGLPFEDLFLRRTRLEVVVTFLAVLELAKQQAVKIRQGRRFGSILIFGAGVLADGNGEN